MSENDKSQLVSENICPSSNLKSRSEEYATNPILTRHKKISNENIKVLLSKIVLYLRKMPKNSRMKNPVKLEFINTSVGFFINKTSTGKVTIEIKDNYYQNIDWHTKNSHQTIVHITLDEEGKMIKGDICSNQGFGISDYVTYNKDKCQNRKMYYNGNTFIPHNNSWVPIKNVFMQEIIDESVPNNLLKILLDCNFGNIILGLANLRLCLR